MNYDQLLSVAQRNSEQLSKLLKRKNLQNARARGPDPSAVAAFKARKEREERERILRAQQEKSRLLALRAQNSKSLKKAQMMKTRTKDNDFSKIVTTNEDRCLEKRICQKSIQDPKERMKARIDLKNKLTGLNKKEKERLIAKMEREEAIKVAPKNQKIQDIIKQSRQHQNDCKPRPVPPLSYDQLLNMASEISQKKVSLEDEIKAEFKFNQTKKFRAMTQKEKEHHREEQYYKSRSNKITLKALTEEKTAAPSKKKKLSIEHTNQQTKINQSKFPIVVTKQSNIASIKQTALKNAKKLNLTKSNSNCLLTTNQIQKSLNSNGSLSKLIIAKPSVISSKTPLVQSNRHNVALKPRPKLPPIGATYRRGIYNDYYPNQDDEDDYYNGDEMDEEDDDMADFIDDGPLQQEPEEEYSKHIREIFGYDKRKYRNMIDDDIEVASYGQVMKEEMRSLREGIKEDLEDIRREEQERKLKLLQKKAKLKGLKGY